MISNRNDCRGRKCTTVLHGAVCHRTSTPYKSGKNMKRFDDDDVAQTSCFPSNVTSMMLLSAPFLLGGDTMYTDIDLFDDTFMLQEEAQVVTRYAHEIVSLEPRKEDIDQILSSHLLSMQALRDKQTREKEQIRQSLTKRQRLLVRAECSQGKVIEGQGNDGDRTHNHMKLVMFEGDHETKLGQTKMADKDVEGQGDNGGGTSERLYPRLDMCEGEQECDGREPGECGEGYIYKSSVEETSEIKKDNMRAFNASDAWKMNGAGHADVDDDYPVNGDVEYNEMNSSVEEEEDWAVRQSRQRSRSTVDNHMKVRILQ